MNRFQIGCREGESMGDSKEGNMVSCNRYSVASLAILFALALVVAAGCAGLDAPSHSQSVAAVGGPGDPDDPYVGQQGRLLLGFKDPDVRTFALPSNVTGTKVHPDGELLANGLAGHDFIGMKFTASGNGVTVTMRIADVVDLSVTGDKWQYALEQWDPAVPGWVPACAEPQLLTPPFDPPQSPPRALAMTGSWTRDGLYVIDDTRVSFACKTGVAAKCDVWGYPFSADPPNVSENGTDTSAVRGADMMQACTRMARADYCAQGIPNTIDGTPIHIDDIFRQPPLSPGYVFEAAWPGVAVSDRRTPRPPVICLSKLRWSTLPLGGTCPLVLPDPRVDPKGTFCDDMTPTMMEQKGARTYSSSAYLDAGLYTYTDPSGTRLTTASLVPGSAGNPPEWRITPPPAIGFPAPGQHQQFEATIFAPVLPSGITETDLRKLASYQCPSGDLATTNTDLGPPGCTFIAHEGYVYPPNAPGRAALRRWWSSSLKRSFTTARAATTMIAAGWQLADVVGGVIRGGAEANVRWSIVPGAVYSLDVQTRTGEWIAPCFNSLVLGGNNSVVYRGVCVSASNRPINRADIAAFRVTATGSLVGTAAYDGIDTDAYVDIPGGKTSATVVSWNEIGPGYTYALDVFPTSGSDWVRCVGDNLLANGVSHVHTGSCPTAGTTVKLQLTDAIRVCGMLNHDPTTQICGDVHYDGHATRVAIDLPAIM